jgi:alkane 1-monooxygenase
LFCLIPILGTLGASNINVAHELFHKDNLIDKWVGRLALSRNFYMHFTIEHIYGHHRNVATPVDPATAK